MRALRAERDERTVAVENASYRVAFMVLSYGLLLGIAYRSFVRGETAWDLLALVIVSGLVATLYQGKSRVLSRAWVALTLLTVVVAAAVAVATVLALRTG